MADQDGIENPHKNRPKNTKFKQQKLPAWKPILTPQTVLPNVFIIGVVFIAVGIPLLVYSNRVKEQIWDYTDCESMEEPGRKCSDLLEEFVYRSNFSKRCTCVKNIELTEDFGKDETFMYYGLENFYQNHRAYVKSRWDAQLRSVVAKGTPECDPLNTAPDGRHYAPCGLVANSLFNDTFILQRCGDDSCNTATRIQASGFRISWKSDRETKFQNPDFDGNLCDAPPFRESDFAKPPNWPVKACQFGQSMSEVGKYFAQSSDFGSSGRGYQNEDLIVWMRTAALPDFRKLYRRIVNTDLVNGKYQLLIDYNYPVKNFDGKKQMILSTMEWNGGHNNFLGICYIVVGCLCLAAVAVFSLLVKNRTLGSDQYMCWK